MKILEARDKHLVGKYATFDNDRSHVSETQEDTTVDELFPNYSKMSKAINAV